MPRPRSATSIEAERRYHDGAKLVDIAKLMNVPEGTVRRWKSNQDWDGKKKITERSETITERSEINSGGNQNARKPTSKKPTNNSSKKRGGNPQAHDAPVEISETNTTPRGGAPIGNQNAVGNIGGTGAPPGNKNALVHGAYETVVFDHITDEAELAILDAPIDLEAEAVTQIKIHKIRQRRQLMRQKNVEQTPGGLVVDNVVKAQGKIASNMPGNGTQTTAESVGTALLRHEQAFNRTSAEMRQSIALLHRIKTTGKDSEGGTTHSNNTNETNVTFVLPASKRMYKGGDEGV